MLHHRSVLAEMRDHFTARGWNPDDLTAFSMMADDASGGDAASTGDTSDTGDPGGDTGSGDDADSGDPDALGDAGKRALDAERQKARDARRALKEWSDLGVTPEAVRQMLDKTAADGTPDPDELRKQIERDVRRDVTAAANSRIIRSEIRALASDSFADADDAVLHLDPTDYTVADDGTVDADAIRADLTALLGRKPHLAKSPKRPAPDTSQGSKEAARPESTPGVGRLRDAYANTAATRGT